MAHDVFISHSSKDKTIADATCAVLEGHGIRCWIAPRDILPGVDFAQAVLNAITAARVMVLIFSSHSNNSEHVKLELGQAIDKGLIIIPFRIENVLPSGTMDFYLKPRHWLDAFTPPVEKHIEYLAQVVKRNLGDEPPSPEETTPTPPIAVPAAEARQKRWRRKLARPLPIALLSAAIVAIIAIAAILIMPSESDPVPTTGDLPGQSPTPVSTDGDAGEDAAGTDTESLAVEEPVVQESTSAPGATWTYDVSYGEEETVWTMNVTGDETVEGVDCSVIEASFSSEPLRAVGGKPMRITNWTDWISKATLDRKKVLVAYDISGALETATLKTFTYAGDHGAPLSVGKSWSYEDHTETTVPPADYVETIDAEVVAIEDVTVPAGEFRCYKIENWLVAGSGESLTPTLQSTYWFAAEYDLLAPIRVDIIGVYDEVETTELVSYEPMPEPRESEPTPESNGLVLMDDFVDNRNLWQTDGEGYIDGGEFHVSVRTPDTCRTYWLWLPELDNWMAQVDARRESGPWLDGYGLVFGGGYTEESGNLTYYTFDVADNGMYNLGRWENNVGWIDYAVPWKPIPQACDFKDRNTLMIRCQGSTVELGINGYYFQTVDLPSNSGPPVGVHGCSDGMHACFDNLTVYHSTDGGSTP